MKTLVCSLIIAAATDSAAAQGRVTFASPGFDASNAITISAYNFGSTQGLVGQGIGGDKYSVQLIWAAGTGYDYDTFVWAANPTYGPVCTGVGTGSQFAAFFANTGSIASGAGYFDAGSIPNPTGTSMPPGLYTMQVLAWYKVGHSTYQSAVGGANAGKSALFVVNATASPSQINSTIFPGFMVGDVPEPSAFSLVALVAAVLLFRRKK